MHRLPGMLKTWIFSVSIIFISEHPNSGMPFHKAEQALWNKPCEVCFTPFLYAGILTLIYPPTGHFPKDGSQCSQFLRHKSYLASATLLAQSSCRPNHCVQHAGEIIITYPLGYHAGFNLGLNCAESVNFALDSWISKGIKAKACECISDRSVLTVQAFSRP